MLFDSKSSFLVNKRLDYRPPTHPQDLLQNVSTEKKSRFFCAKICQFKKWYYLCNRISGH